MRLVVAASKLPPVVLAPERAVAPFGGPEGKERDVCPRAQTNRRAPAPRPRRPLPPRLQAAGLRSSVFVCVGLAVGTAIAKTAKARAAATGLMGMFSAPLAFEVARIFHKGTLEALGAYSVSSADFSPLLIALIKGVEYGCLGLAVGWVGTRPWGGVVAHAAVGLAVGLVFGGTTLTLTLLSTPQLAAADILSLGVNELLFPVGCSMVLFSAGALGKRMTNDG